MKKVYQSPQLKYLVLSRHANLIATSDGRQETPVDPTPGPWDAQRRSNDSWTDYEQ